MGLKCSRWDWKYDYETHNIFSPVGLRHWIDELSFTKPGCLVWFGTQCSSFLLICKGASKRDQANGWLGDESLAFVRDGNVGMQVTSLLFFLSWLVDCRPIVEQPVQSCLFKIKPLVTVVGFTNALRTCGSVCLVG